ncbi:MAG: 3'-5' exonuclease, partial [Chitinophagia bacterium]|nr:3'-5' exonuclease [Chitinophagia bacterium]
MAIINSFDFDYRKHLHTLLFVDIETVSATQSITDLPKGMQFLWERKAARLAKGGEIDAAAIFEEKAALYAEFAQIVCIGLGYFPKAKDGSLQLRTTVLSGANEKELLAQFLELLRANRFNNRQLTLVGHNGKDFDFPFIARRLVINNLLIPFALNTLHKKPWELNLLDTMDMWRFGESRYFVSLQALGILLGLIAEPQKTNYQALQQTFHSTGNLEGLKEQSVADV